MSYHKAVKTLKAVSDSDIKHSGVDLRFIVLHLFTGISVKKSEVISYLHVEFVHQGSSDSDSKLQIESSVIGRCFRLISY